MISIAAPATWSPRLLSVLRMVVALSGRLVDDDAGGLTLEQALCEIDKTLRNSALDAGGLLADYRTYLVDRLVQVTDFRAKQFAI